MRIAMISMHGDPAAELGTDGAGGQNVYVHEIARALGQLGATVDVFSRWEDPCVPQLEWFAPRARVIRIRAGPQRYVHREQLAAHMAEFAAGVSRWAASEPSYRVLHTHYWHSGWTGLRVAAQLRLPLVHTSHSLARSKFPPPQPLPASARTRFDTERAIISGCDCVVAMSPQEEQVLLEYDPAAPIRIVPGGVDDVRFSPVPQAGSRAALGIDPLDRIVLYVGRFDRRKGLHTLLHSMDILRERGHQARSPARLIIVGDRRPTGTDAAEYDAVIREIERRGLGSLVRLAGRLSHQELPSYYQACDVVAVPSYYEPFGLVPLEAMSCGRPVVASAVGGLQHTVQPGENGLLVPPQDAVALATALGRLLEDDRERTEMAKRGLRRVREKFAWSQVSRRLLAIYREHDDARSQTALAHTGLHGQPTPWSSP